MASSTTIEHRRTRFVCVSDTHNASPADGAFKLPAGDVLIHAGDLTKQGTEGELRKTLAWIEAADFEVKIVVAGNHELTLDKAFYEQYGKYSHNQYPQDSDTCRRLISESPSITYLEHEAAEVRLIKEGGPQTKFRVFGTPISKKKRQWAFQYEPQEAEALWEQIPLDTDIVVSHTPPKYHCDEWDGREGCEALRQRLWRVRPRLLVCGHIHAGRGAERIHWDLDSPNVKYKEKNVGHWEDASLGTKKQALLDLSERSGEALKNDGSHPRGEDVEMSDADPSAGLSEESVGITRLPRSTKKPPMAGEVPATRGQGGLPPSGRSDTEALVGRLGRQETCVVNAAILASSWPYKGSGGDRYNKPIVVDLDLPVWR